MVLGPSVPVYSRILAAARRALPFEVDTIRFGPRRSGEKWRDAELIIIPGLGTPSADELDEKLKSPACRRAAAMLVEDANAFAHPGALAAHLSRLLFDAGDVTPVLGE